MMNETAARMFVRRVMSSMLASRHPSLLNRRRASLPTGPILTLLDMLARAQFLEGLAGIKFNSVSQRAGSSVGAAKATIKKLLLILLPTLDPSLLEAPDLPGRRNVNPGPGVNPRAFVPWLAEGSSGLYKAAWMGASKAIAPSSRARKPPPASPAIRLDPKTRQPIGPVITKRASVAADLTPEDVLSANMLRFIDDGKVKMDVDRLVEEAESGDLSPSAWESLLVEQELATKNEILSESEEEAEQRGNIFWAAGKFAQRKKGEILSGKLTIERLGGIVFRFAFNEASKMADKMATEARLLNQALETAQIPGALEEREEFDLSSLPAMGWGFVIQQVLSDPTADFSQQVFEWMLDDVKFSDLNPKQKAVMTAYVQAVIEGRLTSLQSDTGFIKAYNENKPKEEQISANYFAGIKLKYLGEGGAEVAKRLHDEAPNWKLDAEDQLFLMNAQKGRGRFANQKRAAVERALRSDLIRLAHQNPSLRRHLLPLIGKGY